MSTEHEPGSEEQSGIAAATRRDPFAYLTWWAYLSYALGALGIVSALFMGVAGLMMSVAPGVGAPMAGMGGFNAGFMTGFALVGALITLAFAVLYVLVGHNVRRRSRAWWTGGMVLYGAGFVLSLVSFNLFGVALLGAGLALGYLGRGAVEPPTSDRAETSA